MCTTFSISSRKSSSNCGLWMLAMPPFRWCFVGSGVEKKIDPGTSQDERVEHGNQCWLCRRDEEIENHNLILCLVFSKLWSLVFFLLWALSWSLKKGGPQYVWPNMKKKKKDNSMQHYIPFRAEYCIQDDLLGGATVSLSSLEVLLHSLHGWAQGTGDSCSTIALGSLPQIWEWSLSCLSPESCIFQLYFTWNKPLWA